MKSPFSESPSQAAGASIRTGLTVDDIKQAFRDNLVCGMGRLEAVATKHDLYFALALTVRDRLFHRSVASIENYGRADARYVAYLSAEFLLGPHLANNLLNLGITEAAREAMSGLGYDLDEILAQEEEPGLGNGGLGRLAACYMDSLASVEVPALGYGIRYEFGIFDQVIRDGWQCEITDKWLKNGNPWDIARSEIAYEVKFGGRTEAGGYEQGRFRVRWIPQTEVRGVAYDTPIARLVRAGWLIPMTNARTYETAPKFYALRDIHAVIRRLERGESLPSDRMEVARVRASERRHDRVYVRKTSAKATSDFNSLNVDEILCPCQRTKRQKHQGTRSTFGL